MNNKNAEGHNQKLSEFYEILLQYSNHGFLITGPDHIVVEANDRFCSFMGVKRNKIIGSRVTDWFENISTEAADNWLNLEKKVRSENVVNDHEFSFPPKKNPHFFSINAIFLLSIDKIKKNEVVSIWKDISRQKATEIAHKESIKKFTTLLENSGLGIAVLQNKKKVYFNSIMHQMLGYTEAEYKKKEYLSMVHPDDRSFALDHIQKRFDGIDEESVSTQMRVLTKSGEIKWIETSTVLTQWEEKPAIQILAIDITERIQSETALMESEAKFSKIFHSNPQAMMLVDTETGTFLDINHSYEKLLGYSKSEVINKKGKLGFALTDKSRLNEALKIVKETDHLYRYPITNVSKRGKKFISLLYAEPIDLNNKHLHILLAIDITKQKEYENKLKESENRFRKLSESTFEGIGISEKGLIIDANKQLAELLKIDLKDLIGMNMREFVAEESRKLVEQNIKKGTEEPYSHFAKKNDGSVFPVEIQAKSLPFEGKMLRVTAIRDISARIKYEENLKKSEEKFRFMFDNATVGIVISDSSGKVHSSNTTASTITGYESEDLSKLNMKDIYVDKIQREKLISDLKKDGKVENNDIQIFRKDRNIIWLSLASKLIKWEGKDAILTSFMDISEKKKVEIAFQEQSGMIRSIVDTSKDWIWSIDLQGIHTYSNPAIENILGYPPEIIVGKPSFDLLHPEDRQIVETNFRKWIEERSGWQDTVLRWKHKDGSYRYLESSSVPIIDNNGELVGFRGVDRDITERHKSDLALKESEEKFRNLIEQSPISIQVMDPEGNMVIVNSSYLKLFGLSRENISEIIDKYNILQDETIVKLGAMPIVELAFAGQIVDLPPFEYDSRITLKALNISEETGKKSWVLPRFYPVKNNEGEIKNIVLMIEDYTARKYAEEALIESEENFRELMEQSPVAIQILSPDGTTTQLNSSFLKLWDIPSEFISEVFPKFNFLQDEQSRNKGVMPLIKKAFSGEAVILPPNEYNTADTMEALGFKGYKGKNIWIQARLYPVKNKEGNIVSVVNMVEDITERRNAEQEILRLKNNLEIQVAEKTKDLNETISQLERFNEAMVDRELRMKELFDENELLKSQLGENK